MATLAVPHNRIDTVVSSQESRLLMRSDPGVSAVVLQPSYIPWRGYFHQIFKADIFVFYDCVQYDKHGWRNRNQIKTKDGCQWLTIPVATKGCVSEGTPICEVMISLPDNWRNKHLRTIRMNYSRAPFLGKYSALLDEIYSREDKLLADFTCATTEKLARALGITETKFMRSSELGVEGTKTDRLLSVLKRIGATRYISGPSARSYLDEDALEREGIVVEYMTYDYPDYPQGPGGFEGRVSILDLLLNVGDRSPEYIWE